MQRHQILRCPVCDTVVEVLDGCSLEISCCGPAMVPVAVQPAGYGDEHAPMVEPTAGGLKVCPGNHEMVEDHFIAWIEVSYEGKRCRQFFKPGQKAEALFDVPADSVVARTFCSKHGVFRTTWRLPHRPLTNLALEALFEPDPPRGA